MSGRACCVGNEDLCSSEETASNVVTSCQSLNCLTVSTEHSPTHTYRPAFKLRMGQKKIKKEQDALKEGN